MAKKVVIVGAGFGGLSAAKALGNRKDFSVTLIDRRNYHLFQPLLYQVAMAGLSPAEIAAPIRGLLSRYKNIEVLLGKVTDVDLEKKKVFSDAGPFDYDYLILACGVKQSYFGHESWEPYAPGLKTLEQATEIRRRMLLSFEMAERETDPEHQKQLLTFIVVGGGPTGVELAGAIGEISRFTLSKDFRNIKPDSARVILIEGGPRILSAFHESLSQAAQRGLEKLGVQVWTNSRVTKVSDDGVEIGSEFVKAKTVLWAAGVNPTKLNQELSVDKDSQGRIFNSSDLSLPDHPDVFVIGDQSHTKGVDGNPLPGLAPVAMQQGRHVAKTLIREQKGKPRLDFKYLDKGQTATVGRKMAVLEFAGFRMSGFIAWLAWLLVHIYYLIGFKNRLFVFVQWAWNYVSYGRGARLIVNKEWKQSYLNSDK